MIAGKGEAMDYQPGTLLWPQLHLSECNHGGDLHIGIEDIASYAYPPGEHERYTVEGWRKALLIGVAIVREPLKVEWFGAVANDESTSPPAAP